MQFFRLLIALLLLQFLSTKGQRISVLLDQGSITGLKIFPDTSRTAVYAFLGVPYAQPPVGDLRFEPPLAHRGWNRTFLAMSMRPLCPQPLDTIYDEVADESLPRETIMDEDCLYLNIWVSETENTGKKSVLVLITGEEMIYDWSQNRVSGVDLALEDIVVVSIQYRSNIFGWIAMDNEVLAGNLGLQDQHLALLWIQRNIQHFGGDPNHITLLGHGTSGAPCAMSHAVMGRTAEENIFSKLIIMSGGDLEASLRSRQDVMKASKVLVEKLGCQFEKPSSQLRYCLRQKSIGDLLNAFESIYDHRNGTLHIGPILPVAYDDLLKNRTISHSLGPMLIGITSNEGSFLEQRWLNLARESYQSIRDYVDYTVLPCILRNFDVQIRDKMKYAINWFYFSGEPSESTKHFLYALQRLISEYFYELPFYRLLNLLTSKDYGIVTPVFAYVFDASKSMDLRGKINLFGGAPHSADLLLLLGPSVFQQVARRRLSLEESRLSRQFRSHLITFIKSRRDTYSSSFKSNEWLPYTTENQFIYNFGKTDKDIQLEASRNYLSDFEKNSFEIDKLLRDDRDGIDNVFLRTSRNNRGRSDINQATVYATNQTNYGYVLHLKRVYNFWQIFIPYIHNYGDQRYYDDSNIPFGQQNLLKEAAADAARYRKGFFALIVIVVFLLSILTVCVYILHRDQMRENTPISVSRL
ncbi:PREDICTED: liver carboxylesterase 1 isoform X1 [Bactrocera latifrons]|uniref:liver carboxylesterase 1 isoform X1 n=1 Tax=Bactrocera latifrons TaxID=174628 RepID=UPI0008DDCAC3|nr:PREDICTED: liver carboxylesterase 1 isoform X1 [Bactrocera latifrons]